jgi:hypothetical protein
VSRLFPRVLVVLLALAVVAVAADRFAAYAAGRVVADQFTTSQGLSHPARVTFEGIPFLSQVARGRYDQVGVTLEGVPVARGLVIDRIDATLHGVSAPAGPVLRRQVRSLPVDRAEATAFVSYASLDSAAAGSLGTRAAQVTFGAGTQNRLTIRGRLTTPLGAFSVSGQVRLAVTQGTVTVQLLPETLAGVPAALRVQVARFVDLPAVVPALPYGFRATQVQVQDGGLRISATGSPLTLPL